MSILYEIERDYGERRVKELLQEKNIYGAAIICRDYPVPIGTLISTLKACSEAGKIEIIGDSEKYRINMKTLSRNTMKDLLEIVIEYKDINKKYKAIIQKKKPKTI